MARLSKRITKKNGRISPIRLYDRLFAVRDSQMESDSGIYRDYNYYIDFKGLYSGKDNVTFVYTIDSLPSVLTNSYHDLLRSVCGEGVRMTFITDTEKYSIPWSSRRIAAKMTTWRTIENEQEEVNVYNQHKHVKDVARSEHLRDSLTYLSNATQRRGCNMYRLRTTLLVSGVRGAEFDDTIENLLKRCKESWGIELTRVLYNVQDNIPTYMPFSTVRENSVINTMGSYTLTDEHIARMSSIAQGKIGKKGLYFATDIYSGYPVIKLLKSMNFKAENILIAGETGSGKSNLIKNILGQLIMDDRFIGTVMDIEGHEYLDWAYIVASDCPEDAVILNMSEGQGKYFDPVRIFTTGNDKIDNGMFQTCKNFTISLFRTLLDVEGNRNPWISAIIKNVVAQTYLRAGVTEDPQTWKLSDKLTVHNVYGEFKAYKCCNDEEKLALELCIVNLKPYFDESGVNSDLFRDRVTFEDIVYARILICSFGMAAKSENSIDPVQLSLMQISAANISYIRTIFAWSRGLFNYKIWEEINRWGNFPGSKQTLGVALTGGRKMGDVNIMITNKLGDLLKNDILGILDNITTYAVGSIDNEEVRREFCINRSIPHLVGELNNIASACISSSDYEQGDKEEMSRYAFSFLLVMDKTQQAIVRADIPEHIVKTRLFETGVETVEEEKDEN